MRIREWSRGISDLEGRAATGSGERAGEQASFKFVSHEDSCNSGPPLRADDVVPVLVDSPVTDLSAKNAEERQKENSLLTFDFCALNLWRRLACLADHS